MPEKNIGVDYSSSDVSGARESVGSVGLAGGGGNAMGSRVDTHLVRTSKGEVDFGEYKGVGIACWGIVQKKVKGKS